MKRLLAFTLILALLCLFPVQSWAAVAFVTHTAGTPTTSSTAAHAITISGSNPVLVVGTGIATATATVLSAVWDLGGGTSVEIKNLEVISTQYNSVWCVPAPTAGAGTLTITYSTSIPHQSDVMLYSGADQTTPCPTGDVVSSISNATSVTLTPTNLTASDASVGVGVNVTDNPTGVTPNSSYLNTTTSVNLQTGYNTGTTGATFHYDVSGDSHDMIAIRIVAAGGAIPRHHLSTMGVGR